MKTLRFALLASLVLSGCSKEYPRFAEFWRVMHKEEPIVWHPVFPLVTDRSQIEYVADQIISDAKPRTIWMQQPTPAILMLNSADSGYSVANCLVTPTITATFELKNSMITAKPSSSAVIEMR